MPDHSLKLGDGGPEVQELQRTLMNRGYSVHAEGVYDTETQSAVKAFQSQNLDQHGQPLVVDGKVGPLTWWSLLHPKPDIPTFSAVDFRTMPPDDAGGSPVGREALAAAIEELKLGACEVGGNNCGPWVKKYLAPAGLSEGEPWCASFASWCYLQACGGDRSQMPFPYTPGARALMGQLKNKKWTYAPGSAYRPASGDLVFWWRVQLSGWQGHVGMVHQVRDGMLYTIEGNRSPKVQGFSYVLSRMEKLLGYGHVPL